MCCRCEGGHPTPAVGTERRGSKTAAKDAEAKLSAWVTFGTAVGPRGLRLAVTRPRVGDL